MSKGRPPKPRSPREKKDLSYARDRRNGYRGGLRKLARKAIPRRKALENRDARRKVVAALHGLDNVDEMRADLIESDARNDVQRVGGWTKRPDVPLGEHIVRAVKARAKRTGRKSRRRLIMVFPNGAQMWGYD